MDDLFMKLMYDLFRFELKYSGPEPDVIAIIR